jgi:hypothetical protein
MDVMVKLDCQGNISDMDIMIKQSEGHILDVDRTVQ